MAKPHRGRVSLTGESGAIYVLTFGTNAVCRIQEAFDRPLVDVLGDLRTGRGLDLAVVRTVVQMALTTAATPEAAGDLIDDVGLSAVVEALTAAFYRDPAATASWRDEWRQLRVSAAANGVAAGRFWDLTLEDLGIERDGAQRRLDQLYDLALFHAWHCEYFARVDRLPDLKSVLERGKPTAQKPQTWQEQKQRMKDITKAPPPRLTKAEAKRVSKG